MKRDQPSLIRYWAIPMFIVICLAIVISQAAGGYVAGIIQGFFASLTPIVIGALIAFLLKHIIDFIENVLLKKAFIGKTKERLYKRIISLTIAFIIFIGIVALILALIIPTIIDIVTQIINNQEFYTQKVTVELTDFINRIITIEAGSSLETSIADFMASINGTLVDFLPKVLALASNAIVFIGQFCLGVLLSFLYLKDREMINRYVARNTYGLFGTERGDKFIRITKKSNLILFDYFVSKIIEAAILFVTVGVTLVILGLEYAFVLSFILAILNFIPYVGCIIALVPIALFSIIFGTVDLAILSCLYSVIIVLFVTTFISPYIMSKKIKINVLLLILSIIIGGGMFGLWGMLIAPPVVAIISVILSENLKYKDSIPPQYIELNAPNYWDNSNNQQTDAFALLTHEESDKKHGRAYSEKEQEQLFDLINKLKK